MTAVSWAYFDTSAALKLVVAESESEAILDFLERQTDRLIASWLLHTEMHCAVGRRFSVEALKQIDISAVLHGVTLVDVQRADLISAGLLSSLRANDAIHLATAIRVGATAMVTYDAELARASESAGLRVIAPRAN